MCKGMNVNFGNFRNKMEWSREALNYAFSKHDYKLMDNLEERLVHDVYLSMQPYQLAMFNANSAPFFKSMRTEIKTVLTQYGGRDLIYTASDKTSISPSLARGALDVCSRGALLPGGGFSLYLVHEKCSMSMINFLIAMNGIGEYDELVPPEVIEEWSGIPKEKQSEIYDGIIDFIRRNLASACAYREQKVLAISS